MFSIFVKLGYWKIREEMIFFYNKKTLNNHLLSVSANSIVGILMVCIYIFKNGELYILIGGIIIFFCGIFGILSYNNEKINGYISINNETISLNGFGLSPKLINIDEIKEIKEDYAHNSGDYIIKTELKEYKIKIKYLDKNCIEKFKSNISKLIN